MVSTVKWKFPLCVMALQEVPAWDSADGCEYAGGTYKFFKQEHSDVLAFIVFISKLSFR